ncbi:MAG: hypothetical protein HY787_11675 [Deltaproteobacteria bacterium]|nr:hypothetical protein [Deltaproteobacteria bacterium]
MEDFLTGENAFVNLKKFTTSLLIFYFETAVETEVSRTLPGGVFEPVKEVRGEDGPFYADAEVVHSRVPCF